MMKNNAVSLITVRAILIGLIIIVAFYSLAAILADWASFSTAVVKLPGMIWVQLVGFSILSYFSRFIRWHYFLIIMGYKIPILRNLEIYLAAFALTITPGKIGETIRSVYLHRYGVSYPRSIGAFVSERLLDLVAVGVLATFITSSFSGQRALIFLLIAIVSTILLLFFRKSLMALVVKQVTKHSPVNHLNKLIATIYFLLSGYRLTIALALSLMAWIAQGYSLYLIVQVLGYEVTASMVIAIYSLSILAGAASFIPGGLGATEVAIVLLLSSIGIGQADSITASLASRGVTLWFAVSIGVVAIVKINLIKK